MTTAVATRPTAPTNAIAQILGNRAADIAASAFKGFNADMVVEMALHASVKNPEILKCDPDSVFLALSNVSRWGLHIGDTVHLVPFNKTVGTGRDAKTIKELVAIPDYKGLKALAYRQGLARLIQEYPVFEGDFFEYSLGVPMTLQHRPVNDPARRGALLGAWIHITLPHGLATFHYMSIGDVEAIRLKSKQWSPSKVKDCPPWYAMKTCVKNWLNKQPKNGAGSSHLAQALAADDAEFEIVPDTGAPAALSEVRQHQIAPTTSREVRLATPNQRHLLRSLMASHVFTDDERQQLQDFLEDEQLTWEVAGQKIEDTHEVLGQRKRAERAGKPPAEGAE